MAEAKSFFVDIYDAIKNIVLSFYNLLNQYIPSEILLAIGIVLGAFIICMIFKSILNK